MISARTARTAKPSTFVRASAPVSSKPVRCAPVRAATTEAPKSVDERQSLKVPEWVPEQAYPVLTFLDSTEFKLEDWSVYKEKMAKYIEDPAFKQLVGWKKIPEIVNGRLCMLGFVGGAFAEIFGGGPVINQLASAPQAVLLTTLLVAAGSCVPAIKGTKGDYVDAVRDTYSIPDGVFTEAMERVHARLAMVGLSALVVLELAAGRALL